MRDRIDKVPRQFFSILERAKNVLHIIWMAWKDF